MSAVESLYQDGCPICDGEFKELWLASSTDDFFCSKSCAELAVMMLEQTTEVPESKIEQVG